MRRAGTIEQAGAMALALCLATAEAWAQVSCDDPALTVSDRIAVTRPETSTTDIEERVSGARIETALGGIAYTHHGQGDISATVERSCVSTTGRGAAGIHARAENGRIDLVVGNATVTTTAEEAPGIEGQNGVAGDTLGVDVSNTRIETQGAGSHGIDARHSGTGLLDIDLANVAVETHGNAARGVFVSRGILGTLGGAEGDTHVDAMGGSIVTRGMAAHGIDVANLSGRNSGEFRIDTAGTRIETTGDGSHGILALHYSSQASRSIRVDVGGPVDARGRGSHAVQIGDVNEAGQAVGHAGPGDDGYPGQTVMVNAPLTGGTENGAALFLAGGGRVYIGPEGSVGAASGVAIHARGSLADPGGPPRLWIHFRPGDRPVTELFDGRIVNDGGKTTILVNDVVLHDGETGATGLWAPNGPRDVTLRESPVIADRDFDADDFMFSPSERLEPSERFELATRFGPRSAVYEALPGALYRLDRGAGGQGERIGAPDSPFWVRLARGTGYYDPVRSTVGAEYDLVRFALEAGMEFGFGEGLTGSLAARAVSGSADVSAPTGGGRIAAEGFGAALGLAWRGAGGLYGDGRFSVTRYGVDLESSMRGTLGKGVGASVAVLELEAGRRFAIDGGATLTPRAWLSGADVAVRRFTDSVASRVSVEDADRLTGGIGGTVEAGHAWAGGAQRLSLHGTLGVEGTLLGAETGVRVSGGKLVSKAPRGGVSLGMGGIYRFDRVALGAAIRARGATSGDTQYGGYFDLRIAL